MDIVCTEQKELFSAKVCKLSYGTIVRVIGMEDRRCEITQPNKGWLSLYSNDGHVLLKLVKID